MRSDEAVYVESSCLEAVLIMNIYQVGISSRTIT